MNEVNEVEIKDDNIYRYQYHHKALVAFVGVFIIGNAIYQIVLGQTASTGNGYFNGGTVYTTNNANTGNGYFNGDTVTNTTASSGNGYFNGATVNNNPSGTGTTGTGGSGGNTNNGNAGRGGWYPYGNYTTGGTYNPNYTNQGSGYNNVLGGNNLYGNYYQAGSTDQYFTNSQQNNQQGQSALNGPSYLYSTFLTSGDNQNYPEAVKPTTISAPNNDNVNLKNCAAFTKYHSFGDRGGDVATIQLFLKDHGYYTGKVDGVYGIKTFTAVRAFQADYSKQVLDPWNINDSKGTGIWYKSTRKKANQLAGCPEPAVYLERVNKLLDY